MDKIGPCFKVAVLFLFLLGCKKDKIDPKPSFDYLSGKCQIKSFMYDERMLFAKYDAKNVLTEFVIDREPNNPITYHTLKYQDGQLTSITKIDYVRTTNNPEDSYTGVVYEYGSHGIEMIRNFDKIAYAFDQPAVVKEISRIEFKYKNSEKPYLMSIFYNQGFQANFDKFVVIKTSEFEYDTNGNLTTENILIPENAGRKAENYVQQYFYDNNPNSLKQLSYLYFNGWDSAPNVFSTNNKIRQKLIHNPNATSEQNFKLEYDIANNVTNDGYKFQNVVWSCQ